MRKYQSYKPSGVEWIGEIPEHWEIKKNKYITIPQKNKSENGEEELLSVSENKGVIPRKEIRDDEQVLTRSETLEGYLIVKKGDLVSNIMLMWKRGLGVSEYNGIVSPSYSVFSFKESYPKYYHYLFRTDQYVSEFRRNSRGVIESRLRLYDDMFGSIQSHIPPLSEQEQIVKYLDEKTSIIDKLISTKERKIELLKEQRTSLINEVITKGLNPNVNMKDSGVTWIGKIPEGWEKLSLGKIGTFYGGLTGKSGDDFRSENNPMNKPFIPFTNIFNNTYISKSHTQNVVIEYNEKQNRVKRFDIFFLMSSEGYDDLGKSSILIDEIEELYLNSFCKGFRIKKLDIYPLFLNYQLLGYSHRKIISIEGNGFTRINLRQDRLKETPIFFPTLKEQQEIVEYLDKHTKEIDDLVSMEQRKIELLKEYRQSLISEVITGKLKVVE
jgi:type I restriction enzyme S subunit